MYGENFNSFTDESYIPNIGHNLYATVLKKENDGNAENDGESFELNL